MRLHLQDILLTAVLALFATAPARAALDTEELAKIAQNPVGNLISVPFQENLNLNTGPLEKNYNLLNIQPVIPISVSEDWRASRRSIDQPCASGNVILRAPVAGPANHWKQNTRPVVSVGTY